MFGQHDDDLAQPLKLLKLNFGQRREKMKTLFQDLNLLLSVKQILQQVDAMVNLSHFLPN